MLILPCCCAFVSVTSLKVRQSASGAISIDSPFPSIACVNSFASRTNLKARKLNKDWTWPITLVIRRGDGWEELLRNAGRAAGPKWKGKYEAHRSFWAKFAMATRVSRRFWIIIHEKVIERLQNFFLSRHSRTLSTCVPLASIFIYFFVP